MALVNKAEGRPRGVLSNPPIRQPGRQSSRQRPPRAGTLTRLDRRY